MAARPGPARRSADLMQLLADLPPADLAAERAALANLARTGAHDTVRQGAFLALMQIDGSPTPPGG